MIIERKLANFDRWLLVISNHDLTLVSFIEAKTEKKISVVMDVEDSFTQDQSIIRHVQTET